MQYSLSLKKVLVARGGGENHLLDYMVVGTQSFCRQSFFAEARLLFVDDFFPVIIIILVAIIIINPSTYSSILLLLIVIINHTLCPRPNHHF